ncbi:hypothetical protein [Actinoplanes derwentensis]|uniref:DUF2335 domain-containing protein n=1 Tax=Actinoplanes derwentensis TaxID=113562 RepID=A0A1H1ZXD9_9ACTN|nr:hypothetical protein [Actinoplanes derwentensis]GID83507.1 hypothetical protein Ade03nite_24310 [Actinoplanes derwentensis]SDT38062.1 hypothetical protein SAMN04489716_3535 [Actinoplanes derwentensis]
MARTNRNNLPVPVPAPRIVYIPDPTMQADLERLTTSQLHTRRAQQAAMYQIWKERKDRIDEQDRKARRFWSSFGAVIGFAFLGLVGLVGWWLWTVVGLGILALPVLLAGATATAVGGHRCITIVQHMH